MPVLNSYVTMNAFCKTNFIISQQIIAEHDRGVNYYRRLQADVIKKKSILGETVLSVLQKKPQVDKRQQISDFKSSNVTYSFFSTQ